LYLSGHYNQNKVEKVFQFYSIINKNRHIMKKYLDDHKIYKIKKNTHHHHHNIMTTTS